MGRHSPTEIFARATRLCVAARNPNAAERQVCRAAAVVYASQMANISFGRFVFDFDAGLIDSNAQPVAINQRGQAILKTLLAAQGKVVPKTELIAQVWPHQIVEEGNLTVQIAALRKVLGERLDGSEWIITVPRVGYRMIVQQDLPSPSENSKALALLLDQPKLAVLPFQNLGSDPEQDYFADGIAEDIITALSRFKSFAVIARNSSFTYKGRGIDARQVAKELGVRYVLEGSVRRLGDKLRMSAQLITGANGSHLWAQNFDGALDEVFDFQDRIIESVAIVVEPQIQAAELEHSRRERPGSAEVYDLYLRALPKLFAKTADGYAETMALLSQALELEPDNARVLALMLNAFQALNVMYAEPIRPDDLLKCNELARRSLQHAAGDATVMAHCASALIHTTKDYDWGVAVIGSALEANPNNLLVVITAGIAYLHCGSVDDALAYFHRALRLSPRDPTAFWPLTAIAHLHMIRADYAEALTWAARSRALSPDFPCNLWVLIAANAQLGRTTEAQDYLAELKKVAPGITVSRIWAGQPQKYADRCANILEGLRLAGLE